MHYADVFNGCLEYTGALCLFLNCWRCWRDRAVAGVSIFSTLFFFTWGLWNLYYYPSLGQWFSFSGGILLTTANALWIALMLKFRKHN